MIGAYCGNRFWLFRDQVSQNRDIMRRQVPNNIDVVLEQAKVYAYGIEVVKLSQFASIDW